MPMGALRKVVDLAKLVLKRQRHHPGLTLLALLGIVLAVGLVTDSLFFSRAVEKVILLEELEEYSRVKGRPAFSLDVYLFPSSRAPISLEATEQAAYHVADILASEIGLPLKSVGVEVGGGSMMLRPPEGSDVYDESYLGSVDMVYKDGVEEYMEIVAGEPLAGEISDDVLDVWMHTRLAEEMGVHVGDCFEIGLTMISTSVPICVKGFWRASDPGDPYWFIDPDQAYKGTLLVRRQDYITYIEPLIPSKTRSVDWYISLDESSIAPEAVRDYIDGFKRGLAAINQHIPDAQLNTSPLEDLEEFVHRETTLGTLLMGFNVPAFGFLLYFLILTSAIIARWQRRETATLVSRGMRVSDILLITLVDEMLLFVVGCPLGLAFGMLLAWLMGYTSSFLSFTFRSPLPVSLQGTNWLLVVTALAVSMVARLLPTARAARQSVVEVEREQARPMRKPFWYRYYLDLLLVPAVYYAYNRLAETGSLALLVQDRPEDMYQDPLLILVPGLFIVAAALVTMRVFPLILGLIDALAGVTPWTTLHLALRQLGRQSQSYVNPLLLIVISLGLGVYTLSMAASLDQWLVDRMYYRVGADVAFTPSLIGPDGRPVEIPGGDWIPMPGELVAYPGVAAAARVGDYPVRLSVGGERRYGRFFAIDRLDLLEVAWFREDFASESLGGLMNRLAPPDRVLVSRQFLAQNQIAIGDQVPMEVKVDPYVEEWVSALFTVAGAFDHFPTVYDEEDAIFIGNIEYLSFLTGMTLRHDIWLKAQPGSDGETIMKGFYQRTGIRAVPRDAQAMIAAERGKFERVGVFGTLSTGFLASVVMAVTGLLIYSYASLKDRLYRFTVLRAVGLTRGQIILQVVMEYMFLTAYGALAGVLIGIAASELFVPFFRVTGEVENLLPKLIPIVAYGDVAGLALGFAGMVILLEVIIVVRALTRHFELLRGYWG